MQGPYKFLSGLKGSDRLYQILVTNPGRNQDIRTRIIQPVADPGGCRYRSSVTDGADSVSCFVKWKRIKRHETMIKRMKKYDRLHGLKIVMITAVDRPRILWARM